MCREYMYTIKQASTYLAYVDSTPSCDIFVTNYDLFFLFSCIMKQHSQ